MDNSGILQFLDKIPALNARNRPGSSDGSSPIPPPPPLVDLGPVTKAPTDTKNYKVVQLRNGLRATLVSTCLHESGGEDSGSGGADPSPPPPTSPPKSPKLVKCCKGSATICVSIGAGSFHNPNNTPGLAHLVEHLVFLGSKKYPEANTLFTKVFENKGIVNATTYPEHTNFYFRCGSIPAFEECVDILVDGLTNPLFRVADIRREIEAIDSEYGIKQTCDLTRVNDFLRSRAKTGHPFRTFYWGNKKTLDKSDIQARVLWWKARWYCANYMTVCIQAPMPMEKLEKFVLDHFSDIPSAPVGVRSPSDEIILHGAPFESNDFESCYLVAPLTHISCIVISWALPPELWKNYEVKPLEYVKLMLQSTSPGGLKSYLRKNGWMTEWTNLYINCCVTDEFCRSSFCSLFSISIHVTDKGYQNKGLVIEAVFSYLKMLSLGGVRPRTFEEMKRRAATKFHFYNWDEMLQTGVNIAVSMQNVTPKDILTSKVLLTKWEPNAIQNCIDLLKPRTANYCLVHRENANICKDSVWPCGIRFTRKDVGEDVYRAIEEVQVFSEFRLPLDGFFLPREIRLNAGSTAQDDSNAFYGKIYESDKLSIKHVNTRKSPCVTPILPSAYYSIYFSSYVVTGHTFRMKQGVREYWARLINDMIVHQVGHQFDHLYAFEVGFTDDGISVHLEGPRLYMVDLMTMLIKEVFNSGNGTANSTSSVDMTFAEELKKDLIRQYSNDTFDVESLSNDMVSYLSQANHASLFEIRKEICDISIQDGEFLQLTRKFQRRMMVSVEIQGAVTFEDVHRIRRLMTGESEEKIEYLPLPVLLENSYRATIIPHGISYLKIKALHPAYVTSVVTNFYQADLWEGEHAQDFVAFLYHLMRRRIADQLRTKEQLGYTVRLVPLFPGNNGTLGLSVTVLSQPLKFTTDAVDIRIDTFFRKFSQLLRTQDVKDFVQQRYMQNSTDKDTVYQELQRFFDDNFLRGGINFRKLSIQLEGYVPGTRITPKKNEQLTSQGQGAGDDGGNKGMGGSLDETESMIQLEYLDVNDEQERRKLKALAVQFITNVAKFKRELGLLPVSNNSF